MTYLTRLKYRYQANAVADFQVGDKVEVLPGNRMFSGKKGVILDPKKLRIPSKTKIDWATTVAIDLETGGMVTLNKSRLKLL